MASGFQNRRSHLGDFLAVCFSSFAFSFGAYLFWSDMTATLAAGSGKSVGTVAMARNAVQRKYTGRSTWESLKQTAPLYSYDTIRTDSGSEATLTLSDGTQIAMDENTLIVLDYTEGRRNIEFLSGSLSASGGQAPARGSPELTISSKGTKVAVKRAQANLALSASGGLDVAVASGSVQVQAGGTTADVARDQRAVVGPQAASVEVSAIPVSLVAPAGNAWFVGPGPSVPVDLAWRAASGAPWVAEAARDSSFSSPVASGPTAGAAARLLLPQGHWYARVREADKPDGSVSATVKFDVAVEAPPRGVAPAEGSSASYRSEKPSIRFAWEGSSLPTAWLLEVARDPGFADIALSQRSESLQLSTSALGAGSYWWRVRPWYGFGGLQYGDPSPAAAFSVVQKQALSATEPLSPRDGETVQQAVLAKVGLRFVWKADPEAVGATLVIARDQALADSVLRADAAGSTFAVNTALPAGQYWWSSLARAADGSSAPASPARTFTVTDKPPAFDRLSPQDGASGDALPGATWRFSWDCEGASSFRLELSRDATFASPLSRETAGFSAELQSLDPGPWYWRVSALGPSDILLSVSPARKLNVLAPLQAPVLDVPAPGSSLALVNKSELPFSWKAVPEASSYTLRLLSPEGKAAAEKAGIGETAWSLTNLSALSPGRWQVELSAQQAGPSGARSSAVSRSSFTIERIQKIQEPRLVEPVDRASYSELDLKRTGLSFSWKADPATPSCRFTLAADPGFRSIVNEQTVSGGSLSFRRLNPGEYWWRIVGLGAGGVGYSSAVRYFQVTKAPPLAAPQVIFPAAGSAVDMSSRDSLQISWKPVAEATHYSAVLMNRKTGEVAGSLSLSRSTVWEFSKLDKLDVAPFRLTVQALAVDERGNIERKGTAAVVDFSIGLSGSLAAPRLLSPDTFFQQ